MAYDVAADPSLDPRLKAMLAGMPVEGGGDVDSRETMIAEADTEQARQQAEVFRGLMEMCDTEAAAPSAGLRVHTEKVISEPDGNSINLQVVRPDNDETLACIYYIHGGGMMSLSCNDGMYRGWGKIIAANGVAVVMVDFRNSVVASSVPEVAPFPAGLNDCVSGLKWTVGKRRASRHRPGPGHRRWREWRRQPDARDRPQAQAGRRTRPHQRPVCAVPVRPRRVADSRVPVVDREQRHSSRPAQQPRCDGLWHRGVRRAQPAGVAIVRDRRRRAGIPADCDQRE